MARKGKRRAPEAEESAQGDLLAEAGDEDAATGDPEDGTEEPESEGAPEVAPPTEGEVPSSPDAEPSSSSESGAGGGGGTGSPPAEEEEDAAAPTDTSSREAPDGEASPPADAHLAQRVAPRGKTFDAPPRDLPRDLVDRIEVMEAEGELYGALALVDEGLVGHELSPALLMRRVRILARLRRFDEAEDPLRTLRLVEPHAPEVKLASGMLRYRKGLYGEAERDLRSISFRDEVDDRVRREAEFYLAESLNRLSRLDEAIELLHTSVKRFPQARAFQLLGRLYDRNGAPDEASIMYRIAREMST
ncbi:MAG TPA: tetratricopeptide repeat protein [Longimicrobiales bacterium]|nr:tetratricopeptide repeat protein [Longimicrobiales bacterium]